MNLAQFQMYSPSFIFAQCGCLNVIVFQKIAPLVTNRLFLHILADAFKKEKIRARAAFKKHNHTLHNNNSIKLLFPLVSRRKQVQ